MVALFEFSSIGGDLFAQRFVAPAIWRDFLCYAIERGERLFKIGDGPYLDGIVAADFAGVDVYVYQSAGRDVERIVRVPRAGIGFAEARAKCQDHVGVATGLVDILSPPKSRHP